MADEKGDKKKRGAKGGVKHTPSRDHARKSSAEEELYQRKAARKRQAKQASLQKQWEEWDALPLEVQRLRPEMKPKQPRPTNEG